jgi:hypothetical protein
MGEKQTWIVVDLKTKKALHGFANKTLIFSAEGNGHEFGAQVFEKPTDFIVVQIVAN